MIKKMKTHIATWWTICFLITIAIYVDGRKHHLIVKQDTRPYIALSTFGFFIDGFLNVNLKNLNIVNESKEDVLGFSLDKTTIDQMNPYLDAHQTRCILQESSVMQRSGPILFFRLDLKRLLVHVECSPEWRNKHIYNEHPKLFVQRRKRRDTAPTDDENDHNLPIEPSSIEDDGYDPAIIVTKSTEASVVAQPTPSSSLKKVNDSVSVAVSVSAPAKPTESELKKAKEASIPAASSSQQETKVDMQKEDASPEQSKFPHEELKPVFIPNENTQKDICMDTTWPLIKTVINGKNYYNMSFYMLVTSLAEEGLYNLYFHACPNYEDPKPVTFSVDIEEKNDSNYLSAGEMPLPALYFMMSILFFLSGLFWVFILKKSKHTVYKIHYIMAVLVFLKSFSLLFHAINYHFIEIQGEHVAAWAILYYVTHLLKGAVLFITIVLIGTGWTFIKHILSDKDKKIFMIVIPLQVLANVAEIIIDESEESDVEFRTWRHIFIFVDLLCCGAILFPIVWSIRHLHEASAVDGKAAINLRKLKLFRQFYIMIVCYIYFTRIIVYLLKMTVAFQYAWLDEMFHEMATYVFFVLTGYKFRPASSHPYFEVPEENDDEVEVLTESGLTQGLHRTKAKNRNAPPRATTVIIEGNDEERENLITKRESSHEYD